MRRIGQGIQQDNCLAKRMRSSSSSSSSPRSAASALATSGLFRLVFRFVCWVCCFFLSTSPGVVRAQNSPVGSGTGTQPADTSNPSTNGSSSGSGSWNLKSDRPASEVVRDIVIIFFAGVAIIGSLVCATYIVTLLFDRFRGWFGIPALDDDDNGGGRGAGPVYSQPVHVGRLVHEAGLHGISKEQRMLLVQRILPPIPYDGKGFGPTATRLGEGKDVERGVVGDADSGVIKHDNDAEEEVDDEEGPVPDMDDIDYEHTCSICLAPYELGSDLLRSRRCVHIFHWECCQEWLQKRDVCPYCRTPMYTADDLREAAAQVLGPAALEPLARGASHPISRPEATTRPAQDPAVDSGDPNYEQASPSDAESPAEPQLEDDTTRRPQGDPPSEPEMVELESRNEHHEPEVGLA
jgi:Ring finger domain